MKNHFSDADLRGIASWIRRMSGQFATPIGMPREYVDFIEENRLAKFHEWPSGHWKVTEGGWDFVNERLAEDR